MLSGIIDCMLSQMVQTFTRCSFGICVQILVYGVGFGIAAPLYLFSNTNRHTVAHKHFGNNDMTYRQNILVF